MRLPPGDNAAAIAFLEWIRPDGPWVTTAIAPDRSSIETGTFDGSSVAELEAWLAANNGWRNCYFMVNPARGPLNSKASKEDVEALAFLHVDCDPPKGADLEASQADILARLRASEPPPSAVVFSGGGYQAFWRLNAPLYVGGNVQRAEEVEAYNQQLELLLKGDHCHNSDRVMRIPGTWNLPDEKKRKAGRVERLATVVGELTDLAYPLDSFTPAPRVQSKSGGDSLGGAPRVQIAGNLAPVLVDDLPEGVSQRIKMLIVQGTDPDEPTRYGSRSEVVWAVLCGMVRGECDDNTIASVLLDPDYPISAHVLAQKRSVEYVVRQIQRAREEVARSAESLQLNEDGKAPPNQHNIRAAMHLMGVRVSHDVFRDKLVIKGLDGVGPHLNDAALNRLYLKIEQEYRFKPPWEYFLKVIEDQARRFPYHPVRDYLDGLVWDGQARIDQWLSSYAGVEETHYASAVGALLLVAAIRRVREPGCKFDEMVVLESATQGTEKSSALAVLAVQSEWFTDDLPLNADSREVIERLAGRWIVEAPELMGMRKGDVEHLKAFLSRQHDVARAAYARVPIEVPRQCVIVGTTNEEHYLKDDTGNRRFWPVKVKAFDLERLRADRDQLWAEAAVREGAGQSIRLPRDLWSAASDEQEARHLEDPFTLALRDALVDSYGKIKSIDVMEILRIPSGQRVQSHVQRMGKAMRELKWERTKLRFGGRTGEWAYARGDAAQRAQRLVVKWEEGQCVVEPEGCEGTEDEAPY